MLRLIAGICFWIILANFLSAQSKGNVGKSSISLKATNLVEASVDSLILLGQSIETSNPEKAKIYYSRAGELSVKSHYPKGTIKYIHNYTYILNLQGQLDSSLLLNKYALQLALELGDSLSIAKSYFNTGTVLRLGGDYENSAVNYLEGKKFFTSEISLSTQAQIHDILQLLYFDLGQIDKAIEYGERAVAFSREAKDDAKLGYALNNIALSFLQKKQPSRAIDLLKEAGIIAEKLDDKALHSSVLLNLTDAAIKNRNYSDIKSYLDEALPMLRTLNFKEGESNALRGLAIYYLHQNDYPGSLSYAKSALTLSKANGLKEQTKKNLMMLSDISLAMHDFPAYESFKEQSELVADSLLNEQIQKNVTQFEKQYEAEAKDAEISSLLNESEIQSLRLKQKNTVNYFLTGLVITLFFIIFLAYLSYRQTQKLQKQRITELEKEKHLLAIEAVLKGEEKERSRLAKDLHDGLGGMLSGIKYSLDNMKGKMELNPEDRDTFERSIDMLNSSIRELRRVAHNMMPEALMKFGLDTALKDYCQNINQSGALKVSYQSYGIQEYTFDKTAAIAIYRIIQELVNNVIKHASAHTVIIQLSKNNDQVSITVEDEGKGFDPEKLVEYTGMGWKNIQGRVDLLRGKLDLQSKPGSGTSVFIEFNL